MALHRRAAKRDSSEPSIREAFERCGWSVEPHSGKGAPDLIVAKYDVMLWIECKTGNKPLNPDQKTWHAAWKGPKPYVMRCVDDVLTMNRAIQPLRKK
jgi:hypothetical protein